MSKGKKIIGPVDASITKEKGGYTAVIYIEKDIVSSYGDTLDDLVKAMREAWELFCEDTHFEAEAPIVFVYKDKVE